jgi:putative acetyltransferase
MKTALKCCLLMTRAGKGRRKLLLQYAIAEFGANEVDVNEQNPQGVAFYRHMGFEQVGRSELDGQGNPFPLLHMRAGIPGLALSLLIPF